MDELFKNISDKNKEKILFLLEANSIFFKKNTKILTNIKESIIGIILYGNLQITRTDYNGNITIIESLKENDIFGSDISSLNNQEYDIITKEDSKIILFEYSRIIDNQINTPYYNQFIKNFLHIVTEKLNEKNIQIQIITKKTIRDKLLEYFNIQSNKTGSRVIYLDINYTSLANYLSIDRSAMTREIKNLIDDGFIKRENKKITLLYKQKVS